MKVNVRVRLADFGVKDFDQMQGRDGWIYRASITYKGRVFCQIFDEGHGGLPYITFTKQSVEKDIKDILYKMYDVLYTLSSAIKTNLKIKTTVLDVMCLAYCKRDTITPYNCQMLVQALFEVIYEFNEVLKGKRINYEFRGKTVNACTVICMGGFSMLNAVESRDNGGYANNVLRSITFSIRRAEIVELMKKREINTLAVRTEAKGEKLLYCLEYSMEDEGKLVRYTLDDIVEGIKLAAQLNEYCGV